ELKVGGPTDAIVAVLCTGCLCLHVYKVSKEWCCSCCFGNFTRITVLFLSCVGESGVLVVFDTIFDIFVFPKPFPGRDSRLNEERRLVSADVSG
ncbi:unnamed protein product, partial [Heterotrigona itama]